MNFIVVDVESDGPIPGKFSMVCFGAVALNDLTKTFYGQTKPISEEYLSEALSISGFSREQHLTFNDPKEVMLDFEEWLKFDHFKPILVSDNPAFDWQFINYYFHYFLGRNPFGFS
ncbi:MAG: exonuclease, partial [Nanoarchaeota archaeon]